MSTIPTISPPELAERLPAGGRLIDVRSPAEFRGAHVRGAENHPVDRFRPEAVLDDATRSARTPVYVMCSSGKRAGMAAKRLSEAGHAQVCIVDSDAEACERAGLTVERGERGRSIEEQVRIAAGSLVFIGTLAGAFGHPGFLLVPGFVGAGLVFAGITGTCGMGMVLAKAPWNR